MTATRNGDEGTSHIAIESGAQYKARAGMFLGFVAWWALLVLLGRLFAPFSRHLFGAFPDRGLAFAKPLAMVTLTYVSWLVAHAGIRMPVALGAALVTLVVLRIVTRNLAATPPLRETLRSEGLFLAVFVVFAGLRSLAPAIFGAEKYMDFAFFNACLRTDAIPPEDPWLSGAPIHYYYFGYLLFGNLARLGDVAPEIAYNLSLATVAAVLFTGVTSIGRALTGSTALGLLGGLAAAVLGNLDGALQLLEGRGIGEIDYWRSSRVIPNTINEFPFFSFLHGDLHPHVSGLVALVPLVALGAATWLDDAVGPRRRSHLLRPARLVVVCLLLAAIWLGNPWDLPVAVLLLGLLAAGRVWSHEPRVAPLLGAASVLAGLLVLAGILALPFTLRFEAPLRGVGLVGTWTTPRDFMVVFGALLLAPTVWLAREVARRLPARPELRDLVFAASAFLLVVLHVATGRTVALFTAALVAVSIAVVARAPGKTTATEPSPEDDPEPTGSGDEGGLALVLLATASALLLACEIVYLRDAYGGALERMNTVFKLQFQAWMLLAAATPWFVREVLRATATPAARFVVPVLVLAATLAYPVTTIAQRWPNAPLTLDGMAYLDREHSDDAAAIRWLRAQAVGNPVVLEATGDPYSYYARVSSNTGLPTPLGWANHEALWRGNDPRIERRRRDVLQLYQTIDPAETDRLLRRYRIRSVFVGELERRHHAGAGLAKFDERRERFRESFRSGRTVVYEVAPPS